VPRSLRGLLHRQDHGALEDITFYPQLGVLRAQPLPLRDTPLDRPVVPSRACRSRFTQFAQGALVDVQVASDHRDRFPDSSTIRTASSRNSLSYFLRF